MGQSRNHLRDRCKIVPPWLDARAFAPPVDGSDPPLPEGAVYRFDSRDVDGSNNATIADGANISAWGNLGSGGDGQQLAALQQPTMAKGVGPGGIDVVYVDGAAEECMEWLNSTSGGSFISGGTYEIFFVMYNSVADSVCQPFGNSYHADEQGCNLRWVGGLDYCQWRRYDGAGNTDLNTGLTPVWDQQVWNLWHMYGDGSNAKESNDMVTYRTTAIGNLSAGDDSYNLMWGAYNNKGTPSQGMYGYLGLAMIFDKNLTPDERSMVKTFINSVYGI